MSVEPQREFTFRIKQKQFYQDDHTDTSIVILFLFFWQVIMKLRSGQTVEEDEV